MGYNVFFLMGIAELKVLYPDSLDEIADRYREQQDLENKAIEYTLLWGVQFELRGEFNAKD